jgi:hypothetical protein
MEVISDLIAAVGVIRSDADDDYSIQSGSGYCLDGDYRRCRLFDGVRALRRCPFTALAKPQPRNNWLYPFVFGIYGGLFSGGYVTILTAVFVAKNPFFSRLGSQVP